MKIQQQRMTCQKCSHVFDGELIVDAPMEVAIAALKAVRCSSCRASNVGFGGTDGTPPDTASTSLEARATWWRTHGDTGISSLTIYSAFTGSALNRGWNFDVPQDPCDFRRCRELLQVVPEWRENLSAVDKRFPWWKPFVDQWEEFNALYEAEIGTGRCPQLYKVIRGAVDVAYRMRKGQGVADHQRAETED